MSEQPLITIFSAPKPFSNPHIAIIQRNAILSWQQLGEQVKVILVGDENELAEPAATLGVDFIPGVQRNAHGTPLINSIFDLARGLNDSPLLAFVNTDIILLPDFVEISKIVMHQLSHFLLVGQRWDLGLDAPLDFSTGWQDLLRQTLSSEGRLHPPGGSDYFIFPRICFQYIPPFALGRAGWDNWMIYEARRQGWSVVDCTGSVQIVHQDHDYSHLPGGKPHYRLPESAENVRLAGGMCSIFTLLDANLRLENDNISPPKHSWKKFWRDVEVFPIVHLKSKFFALLFFAIFHPLRAYYEFKSWRRMISTQSTR